MARMLLGLAIVVAAWGTAFAANFVVNDSSGGAFGDYIPGDGRCEAHYLQGDCSFWAAAQEANALPGLDTIALPPGVFSGLNIDITDDVIIAGAGPEQTIITGEHRDTVIGFSGHHVTLKSLTIADGNGINVGGGISNYGSDLTLIDCVVRNNHAGNVGGGIYNQSGTLRLIGSTVRDNTAFNVGGGIHNEDRAQILNSTIANNRAGNTSGGIGNEGSMAIESSTIVGNACGNTGGGVDADFDSNPSLTLHNTLIANNRQGGDLIGRTITSRGYNLIQTVGAGNFDGTLVGTLFNIDPLVLPLADNGGPTPTAALAPGSPAINAGDPYSCLAADQRGIDRPQGALCDIGAFEFTRCGDGNLDPEEECDDGGRVDGDGCDSNCTFTGCGNGVVTAGEECDDGNLRDGDCCSSACAITPVAQPVEPAAPGGAALALKANSKFAFSWTSAGAVAKESFGTPTDRTSLFVCVIDQTGAEPKLVASFEAPAGSGWTEGSTSFAYASASTLPGSLTKMKLLGGARGKIIAKGRTPTLRAGKLPMVTPVQVYVVRSDAMGGFGAVFDGARANSSGAFKGRSRLTP